MAQKHCGRFNWELSKMRSMKIYGPLTMLAAVMVLVLAAGKNAVAQGPSLAVGPQYDTTHVYVAPEDFDRFVDSLMATFGGTKSQSAVISITPTPSETKKAGRVHSGRYLLGVRVQDPDPLSIWQRTNRLSGLRL